MRRYRLRLKSNGVTYTYRYMLYYNERVWLSECNEYDSADYWTTRGWVPGWEV